MSEERAMPTLEAECPSCKGTGRSKATGWSGYACGTCGGYGTVLSDFGEKVLEAVKRRLPKFVRNEMD